jgi:hypothetical protein
MLKLIVLPLFAALFFFNIKKLFDQHPVFTTPSGETYPNPWNLRAVLWLGVCIAMLCLMVYFMVLTLQGRL